MITHHRPLRSNMASILTHIAAGSHRKTIFTCNEVIQNLRRKDRKDNWLEDLKNKRFPKPIHRRIANVRKFKSGYKVVGITSLLDLTNKELKATLKRRGFTGLRRGGIVVNL